MRRHTLAPAHFQIPMTAKAILRPNGDHQLDVELGMGGQLHIGVAEVERLRAVLDAFETEARIDDGHNNRINPAAKFLGEF